MANPWVLRDKGRGPIGLTRSPKTTPGSLGQNDGAALLAQDPKRRRAPRKRSRASGKTVFIVAGGFKGFASEAAEAEFLEKLKQGTITQRWSPSTVDFMRTAGDSGSSKPWNADNAGEFLGALYQQSGRIGRLIFIGHGSPYRLGLSGKLNQRRFTASIGKDDLTASNSTATIAAIRQKFVEGATFDIYACNVAASEALMKAFANAFGVKVRSFKSPVWWCVNHDANRKTITSRGRVSPQAGPADCSKKPWRKGVLNWAPPKKVDPD